VAMQRVRAERNRRRFSRFSKKARVRGESPADRSDGLEGANAFPL